MLATVAVERFGGRAGGLIASIPSTIIPASLGFWAASADVSSFRDALFAVPPGMAVNAVFLYCWRVLPPHVSTSSLRAKLAIVTTGSLLVWAVCAAALVLFMSAALLPMATVGCGFFVGLILFGASACLHDPGAPTGSRRVGPAVLVARGALAATAIGVSVAIAGTGAPLLAGMATVFPAIFLTTMLSVWLSQGEAVQAGAVGPMMLGSSAVSAFALLAAWLFPAVGPMLGTLLAWVAATGGVSVPAWLWLSRRARANSPD